MFTLELEQHLWDLHSAVWSVLKTKPCSPVQFELTLSLVVLMCLKLNLGIPGTLWTKVMTIKCSRCWWCFYTMAIEEKQYLQVNLSPQIVVWERCAEAAALPHEGLNLMCLFIIWARNQGVFWLTRGLISGKMGSEGILPLDQKQPCWFDLCLLNSAGCPCKVLSLINMGRALAVEQLGKCRSFMWICRNPRGGCYKKGNSSHVLSS